MYIVIVGGGRIGYFLAKRLCKEGHTVVIIERDQETAHMLAREPNLLIINGDGCEPTVLEEAGIARAQVLAAVTGIDEENFIMCQIAKERFKVPRTVARVND